MILSSKKIDPPKEWIHSRHLRNKKGETVALILEKNELDIGEFWKYDKHIDEYY